MITLAIEQSSACGSVALLEDDRVLAERSWDFVWAHNQELFAAVTEVVADVGASLTAVDTFAVGIGPGSFTGTRIAVATAQALAMPSKSTLFGVSSGEALARDIRMETPAESITIIGDARRHHVWYAHFKGRVESPSMTDSWSLHPIADIGAILSDGTVIAGPDWDRLEAVLDEACPEGARLIRECRSPSARSVGLLAVRGIEAGNDVKRAVPIYLHPPVFVAPKC